MRTLIAVSAAAAFALSAGTASGQKSKDTIRVGFLEPLKAVDQYYDGKQETSFLTGTVYGSLIRHDDRAGGFKPELAKAWRRISDTVTELTLRDDVKWQDGAAFDADDVVYTISWLIDPKTKLRFKANWAWMAKAEKLGPYKVRITSKRPYALDFWRLHSMDIYPEHVHAKLQDKSVFGQNPVGTGPYKVVEFNRNRGAKLEKFDGFRNSGDWRVISNVRRFETITIPDVQTQVAQLMSGGLDFLQGLDKDQVDAISKDPRFTTTVNRNLVVIYMLLDAKGRSGLKALTDRRVRRALHMAVDRKAIAQTFIAGGNELGALDALCDPRQDGCKPTVKAVGYDPAQAKRLLAEAGYPDGFAMEIVTTARARTTAEAVSGFLQKIGVKASVRNVPFVTYRKLQSEGKLNALVHTYSMNGIADVGSMMAFFFTPGGRDYHGDPRMFELRKLSLSTIDEAKRHALYTEALDRINEYNYNIIVTPFPAVFVHTTDIAVRKGDMSAYGALLEDVRWK